MNAEPQHAETQIGQDNCTQLLLRFGKQKCVFITAELGPLNLVKGLITARGFQKQTTRRTCQSSQHEPKHTQSIHGHRYTNTTTHTQTRSHQTKSKTRPSYRTRIDSTPATICLSSRSSHSNITANQAKGVG